jgi:hypothetical protein
MDRKSLYMSLIILVILFLGAANLLAQEPETKGQLQAEDISITAVVSNKISYQGVLKENGSLVTGSRNMVFRFYSNSNCATQVQALTQNAVPVDQGVFSVKLAVTPTLFNGQGLWLRVEVAGVALVSCEEIVTVPYALGLRPGVDVIGASPNDSTIYASNIATTDNSYGIYGRSTSGTGISGEGNIGVYGQSSRSSGYGGSFYNGSGGVALRTQSYTSDANAHLVEAWSSSEIEFYVAGDGRVHANEKFSTPVRGFAEMLPAVEGLEPGDVLVINLEGNLAPSNQANQTNVVGVYSTQPGFLGGAGGQPNQVPLALAGRVLVKVSAENGSIQPGDLLVTSSTLGHAMKAGSNARLGGVIGKALTGLDEGVGLIQMLVMLQ